MRNALRIAVAAAISLSVTAVSAQSHAEIVEATPCLFEYRSWFFSFRRSPDFPTPNGFTQEQCRRAAEVNQRLLEERTASDLAMAKAPGPRDADERAIDCLLEYRIWEEQRPPSQSFEAALEQFAPFVVQGATQCRAARLMAEKISVQEASELAQQQAEERRRLATERRALEAQRIKEARAAADRAVQAAKPGVRIGMTEQEVIDQSSWGRPLGRNRTTTASGTREQWIYGGRNYLYFENGRLTAIQN